MKFRTNKIFDNRFGKAFKKSEMLPPELLQIVDSGFISEDGAWFIAALKRGGSTNVNKSTFPTLTELECFFNHIHLDDLCEQNFLGHALYCDSALRKQLNSYLGEDKMRSIISSDDTGCVFRCHVIRAGERWNVDDLDLYKEEAVLVIDP